jgi:predicted transposase/invertase (TIGR01784 family)
MEEIKQLNQKETDQILKLPNSWRDKGLREGIQEGLQKGLQEGKLKGKMEEKKNIAREMLKEGLSMDLITKITGLDHKEVEQIKRDL